MESDGLLNRTIIAASLAYADGFNGTGDALMEIAFRIISEEKRMAKPILESRSRDEIENNPRFKWID